MGRGLWTHIMLKVGVGLEHSCCFTDDDAALRAIREAAFTWGDVHEQYLSAAVKFADDFDGWTF